MLKLIIPVFVFSCLLASFSSQAQQKFALLVGINKYYEKPGKLHASSLRGCVNDAILFKNMLLQNFGFDERDIQTILDEQATTESVVSGLTASLSRSKAGDAVVFYFSGHGVWMTNDEQNSLDKRVKRGMDQAIVMSDLYANDLGCLLTGGALKKIFNKFVDKGIVLTTIFDCCYSGGLTLPPAASTHNAYVLPGIPVGTVKSMYAGEILRYSNQTFGGNEERKMLADSQNIAGLHAFETESFRSFNLKDALTVNDSSHVLRPSDRPHSRFLSLTGTSDVQRGFEISDETNVRHGAFTKALVQAVALHSPMISVNILTSEVKKILSQQMYDQTPQHFQDPARLAKNLLGISPKNYRSKTMVKCQSIAGKRVQLSSGTDCGLGQGNLFEVIFRRKKTVLRVDKTTGNYSFATVISGNEKAIRAGDQFWLRDAYVSSLPLLKIFIGGEEMTSVGFSAFCQKNVRPLTRLKNYMDYENWYNVPGTWNIFFNDTTHRAAKTAQQFLSGERKEGFVVLLPIPEFITRPLKRELQRNQNIQIVNKASEADYVLYLNYIKAGNPHLDFIWYNFHDAEINTQGLAFNGHNVKTKSIQFLPVERNEIVKALAAVPNRFVRERTLQWLNLYPRRAAFKKQE